ncbi:MAG: hypothetical protein AAF438_12875 [Pseudomonadota bacterium]
MHSQTVTKSVTVILLILGSCSLVYAQDSGDDSGNGSGPIICNSCNSDSDARDAAEGRVDVGDDRYVYNQNTGETWWVINHRSSGVSVHRVSPPSTLPPGSGSSGDYSGGDYSGGHADPPASNGSLTDPCATPWSMHCP